MLYQGKPIYVAQVLAALSILTTSVTVRAQQVFSPAPTLGSELELADLPSQNRPTSANRLASSTDYNSALEDIVVTAERRSENLQKVPLAVVAVTSSVLAAQGVEDTTALAQTIPGLDFSRELNGGTPFIRGVGNSTGAVGAEPSVAMYVDGVYFPSAEGTMFSLNNIERIEVLKGPQGTLFGRNASGGVIQIITKDPSNTPSLTTSVGYGNYQTIESSTYATTGLAPNLASDIAVFVSNQNQGWGRNLTTGAGAYRTYDLGLHSKFLWTPGEQTEVRFSADYSRSRSDVGVSLSPFPGTLAFDGVTHNMGFFNTFQESPTGSDVNQHGFAVQISQGIGNVRFVSISSYRKLLGALNVDTDLTALDVVQAPISQTQQTITEELQLQSSPTSTVRWIAGTFFYDDKAGYDPLKIEGTAALPFPYIAQFAQQATKSYAAFGQATASVADDTRITAGLRYTSDRRQLSASTDLGGVLTIPGSGSATFNKPTWRLSVDHDFSPDIMAYASYNRGFKSGTYNLNQPADPPVKPEVLDAYELGLKTQSFGNHLRINASVFDYNYKDIQLSRTVALANIILNAARARIKGFDVDFDSIFDDNFSLRAGVAYTDGHYLDFPNAPRLLPNVDPLTGLPTGGNYSSPLANAAGNETIRTPKVTVDVGPNYHVDTGSGSVDLSILYYFNDGFFWTTDDRLRQPSYRDVNATLNWQSLSKEFGVKLWAKNLFDARYYSFATEVPFGDAYSAAPPRTYGVTFTAKFE